MPLQSVIMSASAAGCQVVDVDNGGSSFVQKYNFNVMDCPSTTSKYRAQSRPRIDILSPV